MIQSRRKFLRSRIPKDKTDDFKLFVGKCGTSKIVLNLPTKEEKEHYLKEFVLQNFFRARNYDGEDAFQMWLEWVNWREKIRPQDIKFEDVKKEVQTRKLFFFGKDKNNRIVMILRPGKHFPKITSDQELIRLAYYMIERATQYGMEIDRHQFIVIYDRTGVTRQNVNMSLVKIMKYMLTAFQNYYPERMYKVLVINPNWVYKSLFTMIKPFLHEMTKEKIELVKDMKVIANHIAYNQMLKNYGGIHDDPYEREGHQEEITEESIFYYYDAAEKLSKGRLGEL